MLASGCARVYRIVLVVVIANAKTKEKKKRTKLETFSKVYCESLSSLENVLLI